jgi:ABC-2 type transport system permease protein
MLSNLYWPLQDVVFWGFLGSWIEQSNNLFGANNYKFVALLALLLWQQIGRGSNIMIGVFSEELWSNNIVNLFSLPLKITEYMFGLVLCYIMMISFSAIFCMLFMAILYNINLFSIASNFLLFFIPFLICGITFGFMALSIIISFGKRGTELGYILTWCLLPFSGAYYPTSVLPVWGQKVSACFPMSYLFQAVRECLLYQKDPTINIIKGVSLAILYLAIAVTIFIYCFNRSKKNGLNRLID